MNITDKHFEHVEQTFANAFDTMLAKNHDYAEDANPYSNFEFAAEAAGITVEQGFLFLLGVKMARLKQLLVADKAPNHESVEDTLEDTINYTAILKAFRTVKGIPPAEEDGYEEDPDYLGEPAVTEQDVTKRLNWFTNLLKSSKTPGLFEKV